MARTRTLAELRSDVESRADQPTSSASTFVTETEMNRWINQSVRRFVGLLVRSYGEPYWHKTDTINVVANTDSYDLPSDFYQLLYLRVDIDGCRTHIRRASIDDIDTDPDWEPDWRERPPRYRLLGSKIWFTTPRSSHTVTIAYVPTLVVYNSGGTAIADLSADTDYVDGVNGWEEWIVLDVAIKVMAKEESDPSLLVMEKQQIEADIVADAAQRDQASVAAVRNTYDGGVCW